MSRGSCTELLAALGLLAGCATVPPPPRIEMPERLGSQLAVLAIEVPATAIVEGETATFEIEFEVGWRGTIERSAMRATNRPDLQDTVVQQHRQWVYAVATRSAPCAAVPYAGVQRIAFTRTQGKLAMTLEAAQVERQFGVVKVDWVSNMMALKPESVVHPAYPRDALVAGVQATIGVMFEFGPDGKARNAFSLNVGNEPWGFTRAAIGSVSRYELKEPPGRTLRACREFSFVVR